MAIPTQFSVTRQAEKPIPNPVAPTQKPVVATAENTPSIARPSALSAKVGTLTAPPFPLNHARILYENTMQSYASIGDSQSTGTAINALKPNTFERWSFTGSNSFQLFLSDGAPVDTICIGGHNFINTTVKLYYDMGAGEVLLETRAPATNDPIMVHTSTSFNPVSIRVEVIGVGQLFAAYISAGVSLQMQRPFFNGHTPITDADVTSYYHNKTESGNIIGQAIRSRGYKTNYDWQNLDDSWYRQYIPPFKEAIKSQPFFIAWNLLEYPLDVGFGRVSQDISASMQNGTMIKRGGLSFELLGY
jgi:hypothetical protein